MLFFGNKDVKTKIEAAASLTFGQLNKILIATNEADIPAMALSGSDGIDELKEYLTTNSLSAPKLIDAVTKALGQEDNSNNKLTTEYLFVLGKSTSGDNAEVFTAISDFDKTKQADFYGIACTFEDAKYEEWAQTYAPNHLFATNTITDRDIADKGKSGRIVGQNYNTRTEDRQSGINEFNHIAWLARCLFVDSMVGWKFKKLNGVTTDILTDGEVVALEKRGWNGYRNVRNKGQTTGSICTDLKTHADQTLLRDTIIYNVSNAMMDMFDNEEIVPMGWAGTKLVTSYINRALMYCGTLGLIEVGEDGGYLFTVDVPPFTTAMKSMRELTGVRFDYSPNIPMEKISVTGKEILEWGGNA